MLTQKGYRRPLGPQNHHPTELPSRPAHHPLHDSHLPPQYLLYNGRNMPHAPDDRALESRLHALDDVIGHPPVAYGPAAGFAAECRCGGAAARRGYPGLGEYCSILD